MHTLGMRIRLLVNPAASGVRQRSTAAVQRQLAERHQVELRSTAGRGHATELAADAVRDGADAVAVLSGDGTLNEAAVALVDTEVALAALPGGSTNILVRSIGAARNAERAAAEVAEALSAGSVRRVGVGLADDRPFLSHAGVGWDAALVELVERHAGWKRHLGHGLFIAAGLATFAGGYDRSQPHLDGAVSTASGTVEIDGAYFVLALNSDPYTFVGPRPFTIEPGWSLTSDARAATPGLMLLALTTMSLHRFAPLLPAALSGRGLSQRPGLEIHRGVHAATLARRSSMPHQLDGDHLGDVARLELGWRADALSLVVPVNDRG